MRSCLHLNPLQHPRHGEISAGSHSSAPTSPRTKGITPPKSTILLPCKAEWESDASQGPP